MGEGEGEGLVGEGGGGYQEETVCRTHTRIQYNVPWPKNVTVLFFP